MLIDDNGSKVFIPTKIKKYESHSIAKNLYHLATVYTPQGYAICQINISKLKLGI